MCSNSSDLSDDEEFPPRVSVILPVYNGEDTLKRTVDSILAQTYRDFELIIINDGSKDNTQNVLDQLSDSRIRRVNKPNEGLGETLNLGLSLARGEFIARIDADDEATQDRFSEQLDFLDSNPEISVVGSATKVKYADNSEHTRTRPLSHEQIMRHITRICPVVHPSVMVRKAALLNVNGFDTDFDGSLGRSIGMDYHLWIRMLGKGYKFANLNTPLTIQYKHSESIIGGKSLGFKLWHRAKIRHFAKQELSLGWKAYIDIILVSFVTLLSQFNVRVDSLFNILSRKDVKKQKLKSYNRRN